MTTTGMTTHLWLDGGSSADRRLLAESIPLPPGLLSGPVDAHRRLGGPYTLAAAIVEQLVPQALERWPELVARHDVELLSVSTALRSLVPATRETLTSLAVPAERTRFYSPARTLRLAHGLTELIADIVARTGAPRSLQVENADHADPTDLQLLAVLLRRVDPAQLQLLVGTGVGAPVPATLAEALAHWATRLPVPAAAADLRAPDLARPDGREELAAAYVRGDCVSDDPAQLAAYAALPAEGRAALHDERADQLQSLDHGGAWLGALPFHRERGSDRAAACTSLMRAMDHCIDMGFYDATLDLAERGRALTTWAADQAEDRWTFTTKLTTSLAALGRATEAEPLYDEIRTVTTNPLRHMQAAYATAMLYTRHHDVDSRDNLIATGWINIAIALASSLADPVQRAFQTAFNRNGLALVELHKGNLAGALEIVEGCLTLLDDALEPAQQRLHRTVLLYNRGQVKAGLGRLEEAVEDYTAVIALDPNYAEYYLDRGSLRRRLDDLPGALADYDTSITLSPPFPEVYYNRADTRAIVGDVEGAIADFGYVIELDPTHVDALVNRAGLLTETGDLEMARRDVDAGLALAPDNALLHCIRGQIEAGGGGESGVPEPVAARAAYDVALGLDETLVAAWVGRATVSFDEGDPVAAVADLDRAVLLQDSAEVRFNRAIALRAAGRDDDATADLRRAAELDPDDEDVQGALAEVGLTLTPA